MSDSSNYAKYDEVLTSILINEKSILGFLTTIFNFLARRTDFYYIAEGPHDNMGFPPGVAEELVVKVLRKCDPKIWKSPTGSIDTADISNEIMCSTVAQEVEVVADEESELEPGNVENIETIEQSKTTVVESQDCSQGDTAQSIDSDNPPVLPTQRNSETYNGAQREKYSWSQTIMDLDIIVKLPPDIKTSKDLKVTINPRDICVVCHNRGDVIIKDKLPFKIKTLDSFWSISEGKLFIHLEKVQERWWNKFLEEEEPIDLSRIDCSRPLYELPDDHIDKVREMQWNQEQKMKGLPTADQLRNMDILKKAWNAEGSPFKGQEFDPTKFEIQ